MKSQTGSHSFIKEYFIFNTLSDKKQQQQKKPT